MYNQIHPNPTGFTINESVEGETMETKVERILNNQEPIQDTGPTIYTAREDGVIPEYNIRTDRFDLALDAMDKVSKDKIAKRLAFHESLKKEQADATPPTTTPTTPK